MISLPTLEPGGDAACCAPSVKPSPSADEAQRRALVFKALAEPNRLRLLSIVKAGASGEACVRDLTELERIYREGIAVYTETAHGSANLGDSRNSMHLVGKPVWNQGTEHI